MFVGKCVHNPMSLSAVSAKCSSPAGGLCNYGREWCSDATACADSTKNCVTLFAAEDTEAAKDDSLMGDVEDWTMDSDPISFLMGSEVDETGSMEGDYDTEDWSTDPAVQTTCFAQACTGVSDPFDNGNVQPNWQNNYYGSEVDCLIERCEAKYPEANTKVAAGPMTLEVVNFLRDVFGDEDYTTLPAGLGYCVPEDLAAQFESLDSENDERLTFDDTTNTLTIAGLKSATMPTDIGDSGRDSVAMTPPYGQETCGLVAVTVITVAAEVALPGAVSRTSVQAALEAQAPTGADVVITSVQSTVSSTFAIPSTITVTPAMRTSMKEQIATTYGVQVSQVSLAGVRRLLGSEADHRRLQDTTVTFEITTSDATTLTTPSEAVLNAAIVASDLPVQTADLTVADPAAATVSTEVEYTVVVRADVGTAATELTAALQDTAAVAASLGIDASTVVVQVETAVIVSETTTTAAATAAGVTSTAVVAAPVACGGRWTQCTQCPCGGGPQTCTYELLSAALNGGAGCPAADGAAVTTTCSSSEGYCAPGATAPPASDQADDGIDRPKVSGAASTAFGSFSAMLAMALLVAQA
jgi:hypothetical protein